VKILSSPRWKEEVKKKVKRKKIEEKSNGVWWRKQRKSQNFS